MKYLLYCFKLCRESKAYSVMEMMMDITSVMKLFCESS